MARKPQGMRVTYNKSKNRLTIKVTHNSFNTSAISSNGSGFTQENLTGYEAVASIVSKGFNNPKITDYDTLDVDVIGSDNNEMVDTIADLIKRGHDPKTVSTDFYYEMKRELREYIPSKDWHSFWEKTHMMFGRDIDGSSKEQEVEIYDSETGVSLTQYLDMLSRGLSKSEMINELDSLLDDIF